MPHEADTNRKLRLRLISLAGLLLSSGIALAQTDEPPLEPPPEETVEKPPEEAADDAAADDDEADTDRRRISLGDPGEDYYLEADRVVGNIDPAIRTVRALGNVKLVQGSTEITADELYYYDIEQIALLKGAVRVYDSEREAELTGRYLEYHREERYCIVTEDPVLTLSGRSGGDVVIVGRVMEYYLDADRGLVTGGVEVEQDVLRARGDNAVYEGAAGTITLDGDPIAWRGDDKAGGELMTMYLADEDEELERVVVEGTARAVAYVGEQAEEGRLELAGQTISLLYAAGEAERIICSGDAVAVYQPDPGVDEGRVDADAREITIHLVDDIARRIHLSGDAYAVYTPEGNDPERGRTQIEGDEMDLFLVEGELERFVARGNAHGRYKPPAETVGAETDSTTEDASEQDQPPEDREPPEQPAD
jgi:lipopolysaccharide export system protein LptA